MPAPEPSTVGRLARRLACHADGLPLLALRLPVLERTAWRAGRRAARALELQARIAFGHATAGGLRAADLIAHDRDSDVFVAALVAPTRAGERAVVPPDIRGALARIATALDDLSGCGVEGGWTCYTPAEAGGIAAAIERAMLRGTQERERYGFFSLVGHELRTPLASIRGYLEALLDEGADAVTRRRFAGTAYNEALRLGRLLDGMFEISLLDLSASVSIPARGALERAFAGAADACAARAAAHGVSVNIAAVPPTPVGIDADQLTLVLINLVDNGIKHGRPGGRIDVRADVGQPRVVTIVVEDDGPGIPPGQRDRLFSLGQRGVTRAGGTGIGLAVVRLILERAGGWVEARSAPHGGARFVVSLPRAR